MSVLGLDLGTTNAVVAVTQRGGVDILANEASARLTPTLVSFDDKQRYAGEAALAIQVGNLKNTVGSLKQLLGRSWSDPKLQEELAHWIGFNEFVELPNDRVGVKVTYRGEPLVLSPEQLAGMLFAKLRTTAEVATKVKAKDVVVSVPNWFNEAQRRALLEAIQLGGLNPLRIVNDMTALSLSWGFYKLELDEKVPTKVMIVDIGERAMSVGISEFTKHGVKVVSTAHNFTVSGRALDVALANYFADEFQEKRKIDLRKHPKSWFRLMSAIGKVKRILNTNPMAPLNIECIYEEYDINYSLTREKYAELVKSVLDRIPEALDAALQRANLTAQDLHSIELVGSASRTQLFQHGISQHLKRDLSQTLNAEEALAKGCALQCAILSPHFRTREYSMTEVNDHPIVCTWHTIHDPNDTAARRVVIFDRNSNWPAAKNVNFRRAECKPFEVRLHYDTTGDLAVAGLPNPDLAIVTIEKIPQPADGPDADIRLKVRKNAHGIMEVAECELVEKYEEVETPATPADATGAAAPTENQTEGGKPSEPNGSEGQQSAQPTDPNSMAVDQQATEVKKKKKVRCTPIPYKVRYIYGNSKETMDEWAKLESKIEAETQSAIAVADAKNAVESYVYEARDKLYGPWAEFATESETSEFSTLLDETSDWLYGEGEDQTKAVYDQKLTFLKARGDPIDIRMQEHSSRPEAIQRFEQVHAEYLQKATDSSIEAFAHIEEAEKAKIVAEIEKNRNWLQSLMAKQNEAPKTSDVFIFTRDIKARTGSLIKFADAILSKPKPKPKPAETSKPEDKPAETQPSPPPQEVPTTEEVMQIDDDPTSAPTSSTTPPPTEAKMEVD